MSRALKADPESLSPERFLEYAKDGLLSPIAGSWYWDRGRRSDRINRILSEGKGSAISAARARLFQWTKLDDEICELPNGEDRKEDRMYEAAKWCEHLPEYAPEAYSEVRPRIAHLYQKHLLPEEFYQDEYRDKPRDFIYAKVLRNFVADAAVCGFKHVTTQLFPPTSESLVSAISELTRDCPHAPQPPSGPPTGDNDEVSLREEDFRLAREFARELTARHDIRSILREYHQSKFYRAFRLWVRAVLQEARARGRAQPEALRESYDAVLKGQERLTMGTRTMAAGTAAIRELLSDQRTQEFLESVVGRRPAIKCLAVLGAVGIGALVGAVVAEEMIPPVVSQIRDQEWIALLARAPRRDLL